MKYNNLNFRLFFLSSKTRHLWRHHYLGTQGIIFIFASKSNIISENLSVEAINILKDSNLENIPSLFLFDKSNHNMESNGIIENLREELNAQNILFNTQNICFGVEKALEEIYYGIDWLSKVMKPIA